MKWLKKNNNKGRIGLGFTDKFVSIVVISAAAQGKPRVTLAKVLQTNLLKDAELKQLVTQSSLKSLPCNVVLSAENYQILQVDKPNMPENEIKSSLKWKVKELIEYQVEHASVDGIDIPGDPESPNRLPLMFAICARNNHLAEVSNAVLDAGLNLKSIDVHAMVQRNIASLLEYEQRAIALVSILERGFLITFTAKGELYHTRFIELDKGFLRNLDDELFSNNFDRLVLELQRSLDSFDRQFPFLSINKLLVTPDPSSLRLVEGLKKSLYLPVDSFNLTDIVDFPEGQDFSGLELQSMLMPALGAALRIESVL